MFCKTTTKIEDGIEIVRVSPSRVGKFLTWLTRGWYLPKSKMIRDFNGNAKADIAPHCVLVVRGDVNSTDASPGLCVCGRGNLKIVGNVTARGKATGLDSRLVGNVEIIGNIWNLSGVT